MITLINNIANAMVVPAITNSIFQHVKIFYRLDEHTQQIINMESGGSTHTKKFVSK